MGGPMPTQAFHRGSQLYMAILRIKQLPHPAPCKMIIPAGIVSRLLMEGWRVLRPLSEEPSALTGLWSGYSRQARED